MLIRWLEKRLGRAETARGAWGKAASVVGIVMNALLCALKLLAGTLSGSVAITADAMNNLTDASSSVISLLGFKLADRPADQDHPYGHGRYEYLSALMVAVMIMVIGVELMKTSIEKILHPTDVEAGAAALIVLIGSILVKFWLSRFNRKIGRTIGSKTLIATADDSRNDMISTSAVLLSTIVSAATGLHLDGLMGAAVAAFILLSGFGLVKETIDPMLGAMPDPEQVEKIRMKLMSYPGVLGTHDLMLHDYGPGRQFASVHLEMDAKADPLVAHDLIDNIERDFYRDEKLHLVIHYDPVATDDPRVAVMRAVIGRIAGEMQPGMTIHDLRIVPGNTHVNVVFDCVVPFGCPLTAQQIRAGITGAVQADYPDYRCVITLENSYV